MQRYLLAPTLGILLLGGSYIITGQEKIKTVFVKSHIDKSSRRAATRQIVATENKSSSEAVLLERAIELVDNDQVDEAQDLFEYILNRNPENIRALLELSLIQLIDQGRPESALPYLVQALRLEPENDALLGEVADIYVETGQFTNGISFFNKMRQKLPEESAVELRMGQLYYYMGDHKLALNTLIPLVDSPLHHGQVKSLLARIYLQLGQVKKAITFYWEAEQELESGVKNHLVAGEPGDGLLKWLEDTQFEMAEGLISNNAFQHAEDILYKLSARSPSDPEVIKLMDLAKVGRRNSKNAG